MPETPEKFKLPIRDGLDKDFFSRCVPHAFRFAEYCLITAAVYYAALKSGLFIVWLFSLLLYFFLCTHVMTVMFRILKMVSFRKRWHRDFLRTVMALLVLLFVATTIIVAGAIGRTQGDVSHLPWIPKG